MSSIIEVNNLSKSYTISHEPVPTCTDFFGIKSGGRRGLWEGFIFLSCFAVKYSHKGTKTQRVILRMTFAARNLKSYFVLVSSLITKNALAFSLVP